MKIRKLHLKNIGPFDDEEIEFPPCPAPDKAEIHIFTGHNGSGKTTLLMALASAFENDGFFPATNRYTFEYDAAYLFNAFQKRFKTPDNSEVLVFFQDQSSPSSITAGQGTVLMNVGSPVSRYSRLVKSKGEDFALEFAAFAFSGYRQIRSQRVEAIYEPKDFNPLAQSLEFVKDYSQAHQISINQLIANNISKRALAKEEKENQEAEKYARVLSEIEKLVFDITGQEIRFILKRSPINLLVKRRDEELEFDVLPDGMRSLISWVADLLGRVDLLKWADDAPITEKNLILFLDEIEVHLHPAWQRKVLPVVQKLFKNSQIFISTHSPFVVNSIDDAWVYKLELDSAGKATVAPPVKSEDGYSYSYVLSEIFGIDEEFGGQTQEDLEKFYALVRNSNGLDEKKLLKLARSLAVQTEELNTIIQIELRQLSRRKGKKFTL